MRTLLEPILREIAAERRRQDEKWGTIAEIIAENDPDRTPNDWLAILAEEFGELSEACVEERAHRRQGRTIQARRWRKKIRKEAIETAAVAASLVAWIDLSVGNTSGREPFDCGHPCGACGSTMRPCECPTDALSPTDGEEGRELDVRRLSDGSIPDTACWTDDYDHAVYIEDGTLVWESGKIKEGGSVCCSDREELKVIHALLERELYGTDAAPDTEGREEVFSDIWHRRDLECPKCGATPDHVDNGAASCPNDHWWVIKSEPHPEEAGGEDELPPLLDRAVERLAIYLAGLKREILEGGEIPERVWTWWEDLGAREQEPKRREARKILALDRLRGAPEGAEGVEEALSACRTLRIQIADYGGQNDPKAIRQAISTIEETLRRLRTGRGGGTMGDHFEHVGYRYRLRDESQPWAYEHRNIREWVEEAAEKGWQVERLYRRCEDGEA